MQLQVSLVSLHTESFRFCPEIDSETLQDATEQLPLNQALERPRSVQTGPGHSLFLSRHERLLRPSQNGQSLPFVWRSADERCWFRENIGSRIAPMIEASEK